MFFGIVEGKRDEGISVVLCVVTKFNNISDSFFSCYQVVEESEVVVSLQLPKVGRAVVKGSIEGVGRTDEKLSQVLETVSWVEVRQVVV